MRSLRVGTAIILFAAASPADAQFLQAFEETLWGVQASFTPQWKSPPQLRHVFEADEVDLRGSEFSVGFARGRMSGGHWGLSFVQDQFKEGSVCFPDKPSCVEATGSARLRGFMVDWFQPFGGPFAGDRVQVGINAGVGAGWFDGTVRVDGEDVDANERLAFLGRTGRSIPVPMARIEFAVGVIVAPGLKIIGSSGYGLPGNRRVTIGMAYFPMAGR